MIQLLAIIVCVGHVTADLPTTNSRADGSPLVHRGNVTSPSQVPWHVGIWETVGTRYEHLCGGTLIAPHLVITAAHCFWNLSTERAIADSILLTYKVALGKVYRDWHLDDNNPHVQRTDIRRVVLESRFDGFKRRQLEYDIALVVLAMSATMTEHVQLAAVDWTPGTPANGSVGVVAGWGYTEEHVFSNALRSIELPYIDHDTCYSALAQRLKRLLKRDKFCAGFVNQGKSVCQGDSGGGFVVVDKTTNTATVRGVVSMDFRPKEYPRNKCFALFYAGFTNIGDERFLAWIRIHMNSSKDAPGKICPENGSWSKANAFCQQLDCGRQNVTSKLLGGQQVTEGELPWNIAIYSKAFWTTYGWNYECSGTLISPTYIVTTAFCVTIVDTEDAFPESELRLEASTHISYYTSRDSDAQVRGVTSVVRHEEFGGSRGGVHDIAILVANQSFSLSSVVNVACVDWSQSPNPTAAARDFLVVAGIRRREYTVQLFSPQRSSWLDKSRCLYATESRNRQYLTEDKLCGRQVGDDTCEDTNGAGLMSRVGDRYHLLGVHSAQLAATGSGAACRTNRLNAYTSVARHLDWIRSH